MIKYQKIIIIGCPGSGKSTLSIKLSKVLNLPLYHMDNLYWKSDKTTISTEELKDKLHHICQKDAWIIDGNYLSTLSLRLAYHPLIIFLDYDTNLFLSSVIERIEKKKELIFLGLRQKSTQNLCNLLQDLTLNKNQ